MSDSSFSRIAILGTGLIGGSFGLALRNQGVEGRIVGLGPRCSLAQSFRARRGGRNGD